MPGSTAVPRGPDGTALRRMSPVGRASPPESTDGHGSESPSAPALCAMCIFARCNGITVTGCKSPPDRIVASWVRRSLGTCNKTRRHGPSGVLDSRKGRQGGYRRARTPACMHSQQCRTEPYRAVPTGGKSKGSDAGPSARARANRQPDARVLHADRDAVPCGGRNPVRQEAARTWTLTRSRRR